MTRAKYWCLTAMMALLFMSAGLRVFGENQRLVISYMKGCYGHLTALQGNAGPCPGRLAVLDKPLK